MRLFNLFLILALAALTMPASSQPYTAPDGTTLRVPPRFVPKQESSDPFSKWWERPDRGWSMQLEIQEGVADPKAELEKFRESQKKSRRKVEKINIRGATTALKAYYPNGSGGGAMVIGYTGNKVFKLHFGGGARKGDKTDFPPIVNGVLYGLRVADGGATAADSSPGNSSSAAASDSWVGATRAELRERYPGYKSSDTFRTDSYRFRVTHWGPGERSAEVELQTDDEFFSRRDVTQFKEMCGGGNYKKFETYRSTYYASKKNQVVIYCGYRSSEKKKIRWLTAFTFDRYAEKRKAGRLDPLPGLFE